VVPSGRAFDWPQYSKGRYAAAQKAAERPGGGMWGGRWVLPSAYRHVSTAAAGRAVLEIFPDYSAPIVRNTAGCSELAMLRWGMPSSSQAHRGHQEAGG
jgi:hypothetical protein